MALLRIHYRLCHCSCWAQPRPQKRHWALGSALGSVFVPAPSSQSPGLDFGLMAWVIVWIRSNYRLRLALNSHRRRRLVAARGGAAMGSRALERMRILSSGHPVAAPPMLEISPYFCSPLDPQAPRNLSTRAKQCSQSHSHTDLHSISHSQMTCKWIWIYANEQTVRTPQPQSLRRHRWSLR